MNIIQACKDPNLFRPFLGEPLKTWNQWLILLKVLYGIKTTRKELVKETTGRRLEYLPKDGFDTALILTGRRSGKSRIAAIIGAYEAILAGHEKKLAPGEMGMLPIISPSKGQSRIVKSYLRAIFRPLMLTQQIVQEDQTGFSLKNGIRIEILTGDWRTVRGYTLVGAIVDEVCFFGYDSESKVKSDTELIRALQPALATVGGKLVAISSPYARKGWSYQTYTKHHKNDQSNILVWNCPSRTMNPTLPLKVVKQALAEDYSAALAEYMGQFRDDVETFLPRPVIERCVIPNRKELLYRRHEGHRYTAFADLSGGRLDDAALGIGHFDKLEKKVVVDYLKRWRPPFNPREVIAAMADICKLWGLDSICGDNYAASFVSEGFQDLRIRYIKSELNRSELYLELMPRLCSKEIQLLDNDVLINQLAGLERRTRSGGKDKIDHGPGQHDDLANVVAGCSYYCLLSPLTISAIV